jgi:hypothetical protein
MTLPSAAEPGRRPPGPALRPTAPRRVRTATRREKALALRRDGKRFAEIARALNVSKQTAHYLVMGELKSLARLSASHAAELRTLESERLDEAAAALWPRVLKGELGAHDRWLRNRESYRRLNALDLQPEAVDLSQHVTITLPVWGEHAPAVNGEAVEVAAARGRDPRAAAPGPSACPRAHRVRDRARDRSRGARAGVGRPRDRRRTGGLGLALPAGASAKPVDVAAQVGGHVRRHR